MYKTLLFEAEAQIAKVTINRPQVQNALAAMTTYEELQDAAERCSNDPEIRAVVFTGVGKNFSAGGDIAEFKERIESGKYIPQDDVRIASTMARAMKRCAKPTIAMINGTAAGAGMSVALACDFRVMATTSKMSMAFIRMGLSGDTGGIFNLAQCVGPVKALEYMMTGDSITADEALRSGLAYTVCEPEELESVTMKLATRLANGPTYAYRKQKELMWGCFYGGYDSYANAEAAFMSDCSKTGDFAEAADAFLSKRKPAFTGK